MASKANETSTKMRWCFICGRELVVCRRYLTLFSKVKKDLHFKSILTTILGQEIIPTKGMKICEMCDSRVSKWRKGTDVANQLRQLFLSTSTKHFGVDVRPSVSTSQVRPIRNPVRTSEKATQSAGTPTTCKALHVNEILHPKATINEDISSNGNVMEESGLGDPPECSHLQEDSLQESAPERVLQSKNRKKIMKFEPPGSFDKTYLEDVLQISAQSDSNTTEGEPSTASGQSCAATNSFFLLPPGLRPETEHQSTVSQQKLVHCLVTRNLLELELENRLLKKQLQSLKSKVDMDDRQEISNFEVGDVRGDDCKCRFYTGLTWLQFICLWDCLGSAKYALHKSIYWRQLFLQDGDEGLTQRAEKKLSLMDELFLTLVRLRLGLLNKDIAYRFEISEITAVKIFTGWIQFLYVQFDCLRDEMLRQCQNILRNLPDIRIIIECTKFYVENMKSSESQKYNYSTLKCLTAIDPNGAVIDVSPAFDGSLPDNDIISKSGLLKKCMEGDVIVVDRAEGSVRYIFFKKTADDFLNGRVKCCQTSSEICQQEQISQARIHVSKVVERLKKFRLLTTVMPISVQPILSQMVFVASYLSNFQEPL